MLKKVRIKIESSIDNLDSAGIPDGDSEKTVTEAEGTYRFSSDDAVITYKERAEGTEISSRITVVSDSVSVRRSGGIESELFFSEGVAHSSVYGAPPYTFDMRIFTRRIRGGIGEHGGSLDIFYDMEIGGAKKSVKMTVACDII